MDAFATHIPFLAAAAGYVCGEGMKREESAEIGAEFGHTTATVPASRILELGAGEYSTPMLHAIAHACGAELLTLGADDAWLAKYRDLMAEFHELRHVPDWAAEAAIDEPWDLAFVDHAPAERRRFDLARLANNAEVGIVVLHDTEPYTSYGYDQAIPLFKFVATCKRWKTWTSVCSNAIDVGELFGRIAERGHV